MMMSNSWMEVLHSSPPSFPNSNCLHDQRRSRNWTLQENELFENALAYFDKDTADRWVKVAGRVPGKTATDVFTHYQDLVEDVNHIEAGFIPSTGYFSPFTLDWESNNGIDVHKPSYGGVGSKRTGARADRERKKGVPWTEEEHKLFLMGLKKYGKGDWRNISRNFVVSRTPTQVASHAQKYFIRLNSGSKDKRRSSIHDMTTANLPNNRRPLSPPPQSGSSDQLSTALVDPNQRNEEEPSVSTPPVGASPFMQLKYGMNPYAMKLESQHLHRGCLHS